VQRFWQMEVNADAPQATRKLTDGPVSAMGAQTSLIASGPAQFVSSRSTDVAMLNSRRS
jgi:hypothetical protein